MTVMNSPQAHRMTSHLWTEPLSDSRKCKFNFFLSSFKLRQETGAEGTNFQQVSPGAVSLCIPKPTLSFTQFHNTEWEALAGKTLIDSS